VDARGGTVLPGFVDAHTHVVFAGDRSAELARRLAGATYADIAASGGGIVETVRATRAASEDELFDLAATRMDEMLLAGTTSCEAKSGYGLELAAELKILRVIDRLNRRHAVDLSPTFLGAHEIPFEHRGDRRQYIETLVHDMIPAVARSGLAEWCDVFCETGVFTPEESQAILAEGRRHGLKPRIHADELTASGGWRVAAELGARSADHLVCLDQSGALALATAGVVATLLPSAPFFLKLGRFAPARTLIESETAVALGTDVNPGGGYSPSMPFAMTLACFEMNMTLEEAIVAATINAAYAIDRHTSVGSLEAGKLMDAVIIAGRPADLMRMGSRVIRTVIKRGRIVVDDFALTSDARDPASIRTAAPEGAADR
jgi:imidazolonepropionase